MNDIVVNLDLLKYINYINNCISNDFDLSLMNKIYIFTNTLNLNVNEDFKFIFSDESINIELVLRHSIDEGIVVFSDFYYTVDINLGNKSFNYSLELQSWGEDMADHNFITYRKIIIETCNIISVPHLIEKQNELSKSHFGKEVLKVLEINTGELFTYLGKDLFPFGTLLKKPYNLIARYDKGKIYLAKHIIISHSLKVINSELIIDKECFHG